VKRFAFSLERVLRFKRQLEQAAEVQQQQAALALQRARADVVALQALIDQAAAGLERCVSQPVDLGSWLARLQHSAGLNRALAQAEHKSEQAALNLRKAAAKRQQIAAEVEALRVLRRQQWQVYRKQAEQARQEMLDEMGLRRWQERRGKSADQAP
jgi:hypothetical protein